MNYEILYIISGQNTDDDAEKIKEKATAAFAKAQAEVTRNENLGKLKLAYPIKHVRHGFYILVEFKAEPGAVKAIERELGLMPEILRYQSVRLSDSPNGEEEKKEIKMISYEAPEREEDRQPKSRGEEKKKVPAKKPAKKVNLEELDKKLDEILESDVEI
jgi:small subunit ribosomal protein S6